MRPLAILAGLLVAVAAATAVAASTGPKPQRYLRYSFSGDARAGRGADAGYRLRVAATLPGSWRARSANGRRTQRFGPIGSCRYTVTVRSVVSTDREEEAVARVARLLPATGGYLRDEGTHGRAAFRVVRRRGSDTIDALLTRAAPNVLRQPRGGRLWLELRATGVADPRTECHSGGPRTIAEHLGRSLSGGELGGFQLTGRR